MPWHSINDIAALVGADRNTVSRRIDQLALPTKEGPKRAILCDTRQIIQLVPPPTKSVGKLGEDGELVTRDQAQTRKELALARKTEIEIERMEGRLADVTELLERQQELFSDLGTIVKKSSLTEAEKEDMLEAMTEAARKWAEINNQ